MSATIRPYADTDFAAVARVWREIGWIDDDEREKEGLRSFLSVGDTEVALLRDEAECLAHRSPGTIHYLDTPLPLCAVTAVATSNVARKRGFAQRLTGRALQHGRESGAAVAALGMFDQGFYDRVGFGTSSYDHLVTLDPSSLQIDVPYRPPARLGVDDYAEIHAALASRLPAHGSVSLAPPELLRAELLWIENLVGLGYRDDDGRLTHGFWGSRKGEHGPLRVHLLAYRSPEQLLEVLRAIRELGDQIHTVEIPEPAHVQLQALLREPMRQRSRSKGTPHQSGIWSVAWTQIRIIDLEACVAARRWDGPEVAFALTLTDPLGDVVGEGWPGLGGKYTVTVGAESTVTEGHVSGLPELTCSIGSFTRLWFGVVRATALPVSDRVDAWPGLLESLEPALTMPPMRVGWEF